MILQNIDELKTYISQLSFVKSLYFLEQRDILVYGKVEIAFEGLEGSLDFEIQIFPSYPLRSYDSESIKFINEDLRQYDHVMGDGSICIHTSHEINLEKKLVIDFNSLKDWIIKYYINKDTDLKYEHIIVPESSVNDIHNAYLFTELDYEFKKNDFGEVAISYLNAGSYKEEKIQTFIIQGFIPLGKESQNCKWSEFYRNLEINKRGLYIFTENVPAEFNRFAFDKWIEFGKFFNQKFLSYLHEFEKRNLKKYKGKNVPLFIGYKTIDDEIHWQVVVLTIGNFPLKGISEKINGRKTHRWLSELTAQEIYWGLSRNSSYKYFFGRGTFSKNITDKKILILGIGAIGSMVATTLIRGGCKFIDLADHDVKEPENVCRSEYMFDSGVIDKVQELTMLLHAISPFVEIASFKKDCFETIIKFLYKEKNSKEDFEVVLNQYDIVFDCTTDNDLMYILSTLELECDLINMSITNHAKELVCAFYPNAYKFVNNQFSSILQNDLEDLYNPTGCWSPTFKASYNDINILVQMALKHINILYQRGKSKNNFIIKTDDENLFNIKIEEY